MDTWTDLDHAADEARRHLRGGPTVTPRPDDPGRGDYLLRGPMDTIAGALGRLDWLDRDASPALGLRGLSLVNGWAEPPSRALHRGMWALRCTVPLDWAESLEAALVCGCGAPLDGASSCGVCAVAVARSWGQESDLDERTRLA